MLVQVKHLTGNHHTKAYMQVQIHMKLSCIVSFGAGSFVTLLFIAFRPNLSQPE